MFTRYRKTLAQVRASYTREKAAEEKRSELAAFWIYRPLSFYVTPPFLALGWTADGVTALQFGIALLMLPAALAGGFAGASLIVGLALLMQVLDCVDGNIARVTQRYSAAGGMLDGLCSLLFWALFFVATGMLTQGGGTGWIASHGREIGLILAALFLAQREAEDTFTNCFDERIAWTPPTVKKSDRFSWLGKVLEQSFAFGGLLLAAALGRLDWLLATIFAYQAALLLVWLPRFVGAVHKRSKQPRGNP